LQTIYLTDETKLTHPTVATIGNFDGIHLGHKVLVEKLVLRAKQNNVSSAVVTFEPHTREVITNSTVPRLSLPAEKEHLLKEFGVDYLIIIPFTKSLAEKSKDFFTQKILKEQLNIKELVMGEDHSFGSKTDDSKKSVPFDDEKNDIRAIRIKLYGENSITAGSTQIRELLESGNVEEAMNMLGHPYLILGTRIRGKRLGSKLGYPTLNFSSPPSQKIVPPAGVYAAEVEYGTQRLHGCLYFGDCPTFGERDVHFEFFSLDLIQEDPVVGIECKLWLHKHIRENVTFVDSDKLVEQITKDVKAIKSHFMKE
jgi:riboflavin kinase/FMN adenylyltransferase